MNSGERSVVEMFGFVLAILAVVCLGAAAMAAVNVVFGFRDGAASSYVAIAIGALALAIILGFVAGYLMSWSDPVRRGILGRK